MYQTFAIHICILPYVPEVQASDRHRKQTCPRTAGATATEGAIHQEPMENSRFFLFNDDPLLSLALSPPWSQPTVLENHPVKILLKECWEYEYKEIASFG